MKELKERLENIVKNRGGDEDLNEDFNAMEDSGGNFDDAYSMGTEDGELWLARSLLKDFFNK